MYFIVKRSSRRLCTFITDYMARNAEQFFAIIENKSKTFRMSSISIQSKYTREKSVRAL